MNKRLMALSGALVLMSFAAVYAPAQAPEFVGEGLEENEAWQKEGPAPEMGVETKFRQKEGFVVRKHLTQDKKFGGENSGFLNENQVFGTIKKHDSKFAETLADLRETAPAEYRMTLMMSRKLLEMARKENDEKIEADAVHNLSLEYDTRKLSRKYEHASDADKAVIKAELKGKVSELFDLRLKGHQIRVQRMEKELVKLKKNIETRKGSKDKIVQDRIGQLTGEGFGW